MTAPGDAIWTSLPVPALILDPRDVIARLNPAAEGFLNASARTLAGASLWEALSFDSPLDDAVGRARAQDAPLFVNDVKVGAATRASLQCNVQVAPLAGSAGHMVMLLSPRELAGRLTQGHSAHAAARSAIGMAEMLAHEIKNPLAGITGAAQLLSMGLGAEDRELTDLIVAESRRIVTLLERVEEFGNLAPPRRAAFNIHDVLDRARRSAQVGFAAHMTITEDYDPSLPPALGDADQLLQVLQNLLRNAAEAAGGRKGAIRLRTHYDHSLRMRGAARALPLQIEVIDDGPGLPPDIAEDVFDPFVSGRENGAGLGLALAAKIVAGQGGWITVASAPGDTMFRISLPRARPDEAEEV
ncbi:PAS domain-containing sensor histidine kinase [Roseovarius spongiae]|uniref:histidine kinase n=1 Tax=Roseovarius spongiae TaxID=2320272 RepID=A0A3A8AVV0_9RHOB|nr:ATP-binding protein [Roseovarius spongiae]RKF15187.1 PAS domain-containing sensor histidine kinase [Roseovarius spongiae]